VGRDPRVRAGLRHDLHHRFPVPRLGNVCNLLATEVEDSGLKGVERGAVAVKQVFMNIYWEEGFHVQFLHGGVVQDKEKGMDCGRKDLVC
jgi:hypothetical protein